MYYVNYNLPVQENNMLVEIQVGNGFAQKLPVGLRNPEENDSKGNHGCIHIIAEYVMVDSIHSKRIS